MIFMTDEALLSEAVSLHLRTIGIPGNHNFVGSVYWSLQQTSSAESHERRGTRYTGHYHLRNSFEQ